MRECVVSLQAVKIMRLPGYTPDVDTLGTLVWARTPAGVWWPGEALDPHHMPPTRSIPQLAAAGEAFLSFRLRRTTQGTLEPRRDEKHHVMSRKQLEVRACGLSKV